MSSPTASSDSSTRRCSPALTCSQGSATYSLTEAAIQPVPVLAELGAWGVGHRDTTPRLGVRGELLASGGPKLWAEFMDELRELHLAQSHRHNGGPSVMEGLSESYARASTSDLTGERAASAKTGAGEDMLRAQWPMPPAHASPRPRRSNRGRRRSRSHVPRFLGALASDAHNARTAEHASQRCSQDR